MPHSVHTILQDAKKVYDEAMICPYRIKLLTIAALAMLSIPAAAATADDLALIPQPRSVRLTAETTVRPSDTVPHVTVDPLFTPLHGHPEGYLLTVSRDGITIEATDSTGAIRARQTLRQLRRPDGSYPLVRITDWPEFPIRGFMYDDGRNFAGVDRIKSYLDLMGAYKLNVFQWHLTDRPAWRIESKAYPRLNDGKFQRPGRDQGCFYTYDEIRDVIAYARARGIMVVPEIDIPGHSDYFMTAFGQPMDSEEGRRILEECIGEFCREIPASLCPWLHIGSDEVRIHDQEGFMKWAQDLVRRHGRTAMVWDPGLPADSLTIRQLWRNAADDKAQYPASVRYIDSAMGYLNLFDPLLMPARLFFHQIGGTGRHDGNCLGGIICLWNDVRVADKDLTARHNGLAGGVMAFSERAWSGPAPARRESEPTIIPAPDDSAMTAFERFQQRMETHRMRVPAGEMDYWAPLHASEWLVEIDADTMSRSFTAYGDVLDLDALCAARGIPSGLPVSCRLTRRIHSDTDTVRRFMIGFEAPARSNRISDGIAPQGRWPNYGTVTVNGTPLPPPVWREPETYRYHYNTWARPEEELPYTDEQLYWMRRPVKVALRRGDNTVVVTLRRHFRGQRFQASFIESLPNASGVVHTEKLP